MLCHLSHEEKPLQDCQNKKCPLVIFVCGGNLTFSNQTELPQRSSPGESCLSLDRLLASFPREQSKQGKFRRYLLLKCLISAEAEKWWQALSGWEVRALLKGPKQPKTYLKWPVCVQEQKRDSFLPSVLAVLFCHTQCMSRVKGRMGELTQKKKSCPKKLSNQSSKN